MISLAEVLHVVEYPTALEAAGFVAAAFAAWTAARSYGPAPGRVRAPRDVPSPDALSRLNASDRELGFGPVLALAEEQLRVWQERATGPPATPGAATTDGGSLARQLHDRVHRLRVHVERREARRWGRAWLPPVDRALSGPNAATVARLLEEIDRTCHGEGAGP